MLAGTPRISDANAGFTNPISPSQGGTGTSTVFTQGSVVFAGASGIYSQDNANFFYDATNHRLGLGTNTPDNVLNVSQANGAGDVGIVIQNNATTTGETASLYFRTTTSTTNFATVQAKRLAGGASLNLTTVSTSNTAVANSGITINPASASEINYGFNTLTPAATIDVRSNDAGATTGDFTVNTVTSVVTVGRLSSTTNTSTSFIVQDRNGNISFTVNSGHATGLGITNMFGGVGIGVANGGLNRLDIADTSFAASGSLAGSLLNLTQTWNTSGTPTAILLNVTNTASTGTPKLIDLQVGGNSNFSVAATGSVAFTKTITASGTTGAQTINKSSGTVNFAASAGTLVVTNSLVTANSIILCQIATNDALMTAVQITQTAGSFTIIANSPPAGITRVNFLVLN